MSDMEIREVVRSLLRQHLLLHGHMIHSISLSSGIRHGLSKPSVSLSLLSSTTAASPNLIDIDDMRRIGTGEETRTTLMIKRIPRKYTLELLRQEIDSVMGESGLYDLLYLPVGMRMLIYLRHTRHRLRQDDKQRVCFCEFHK